MKKWIITHQDLNKRIDVFLSEHLDLSRTKLNEMIKNDKVRCNNIKVKAKYKLKENDCVELDVFEETPHQIDGVAMAIDIVYEDDYLCVVHKPKGMAVHPGKGNHDNTLLHGLIHHFKGKKPGMVHRLDKDTEGLLIVAKDVVSHARLSKQVESKTVKRFYCALVHGNMNEDMRVDARIGNHKYEKKMAIDGINAKDALTYFTPRINNPAWTLVDCELFTGRTHQIRIHAQSIGHPLIEDPLYGIDPNPKGQYLFAYRLEFNHPMTKERMQFERPLPETFNEWIGAHQ